MTLRRCCCKLEVEGWGGEGQEAILVGSPPRSPLRPQKSSLILSRQEVENELPPIHPSFKPISDPPPPPLDRSQAG